MPICASCGTYALISILTLLQLSGSLSSFHCVGERSKHLVRVAIQFKLVKSCSDSNYHIGLGNVIWTFPKRYSSFVSWTCHPCQSRRCHWATYSLAWPLPLHVILDLQIPTLTLILLLPKILQHVWAMSSGHSQKGTLQQLPLMQLRAQYIFSSFLWCNCRRFLTRVLNQRAQHIFSSFLWCNCWRLTLDAGS